MEEGRLVDIGEREAIRRLARRAGAGPDVVLGIGDDCAVVAVEGAPFDWLLTTDPVIEGVHFLPDTAPARIGHKAAGRVLSDIAAMGGEAMWVLFDLVADGATPVGRLEEIYAGATALCGRHGAAIVGGDLARGPCLELHAFAVGRVPRGTALTRSGARPGDAIFVTGRLGGSIRGRHLDFEPRLVEGRWLREGGWAVAMMDLSDGLAADLRRMLERSGAGAVLDLGALPVSPDAGAMGDGRSAAWHALCDGEDFELLFTVPDERRAAFERAWEARFDLACTAVGTITKRPGELLALDGSGAAHPLREDGYEHFAGPGRS